MNPPHLAGWLPIDLYWSGPYPVIDWCYAGERRLSEPFFEQTVNICLRQPFNLLFRYQTSIETLIEWQAQQPGIPPTGFIFHTSRCGSTLIAQMLAALPQNILISEAGPIDKVLRAHLRQPLVSDEEQATWLRALISALGQRRNGVEKHLFIKFDSWSILALSLIRQVFPEVPWIFVYRHPIEVMVSHLNQPGSQMVPGLLEAGLFGLEAATVRQIPLADYCARVLGVIFQTAAQGYCSETGQLVHYEQLPHLVYSLLPNLFGLAYPPDDLERMQQVTQFHAKNPSLPFMADSQTKRQAATPQLCALAERWVTPYYEKLEALRLAQLAAWPCVN